MESATGAPEYVDVELKEQSQGMVQMPDAVRGLDEFEQEYSEPWPGKAVDACGWMSSYMCVWISCGNICSPYQVIQKGYYGAIQRFGRVVRVVQEGMYPVNPLCEKMIYIDMRSRQINLQAQTVLTKDNLGIMIDGVVRYRIKDLDRAIFSVQNVNKAVFQLSLVALRSVFGTKEFQQCLEERQEMAEEIGTFVQDHIKAWGIEIEFIKLTDIIIPADIQEFLSAIPTAHRQSAAKVLTAQADVESAKLMREAADALNSNAAMQIRLLETYENIAKSGNAKVIFMPLDKLKNSGNIQELGQMLMPPSQ